MTQTFLQAYTCPLFSIVEHTNKLRSECSTSLWSIQISYYLIISEFCTNVADKLIILRVVLILHNVKHFMEREIYCVIDRQMGR